MKNDIKHRIFKTILAATLVAGAQAADGPSVRLVQYQAGAALSDKVPFDVKPMNHSYGAKLVFLLEGENMVTIADDSLEITSMTAADGSELVSTKGRGNPVEQGSFPKVSEDGTIGSFSAEIRGDMMGKLEGAKLEGKITIRTGSESKEQNVKLSLGDKAVEVGPFKISAEESEGFGGNKGLQVTVIGDYESIIELSVEADGKKLDSEGSSWSGKQKSFNFAAVEAKAVDVTLSYWVDLKDVEVPLKLTVGE